MITPLIGSNIHSQTIDERHYRRNAGQKVDGAKDRKTAHLGVEQHGQQNADYGGQWHCAQRIIAGVVERSEKARVAKEICVVGYANPLGAVENGIKGKAVVERGKKWIDAEGQKADNPRQDKEQPVSKRLSFLARSVRAKAQHKSYPFNPVSVMPSIKVRWAKKNRDE